MSQNVPGEQPAVPQPEQPAAPAYSAPAAPAAPAYGAAAVQPKGLAITALILGIASIVFCWVWWLSIPAGVVGLVLGIIGLRKGQPRGMALTGVILSAIGIVIAIILIIVIAAIVAAAIQQGLVTVS